MTSFSRIAVRNSAAGIAAQMIIKLLSFLFSVMIVRHLGAEQYGQYTAVLAFGAIFVFLSDLGLSPYAVRAIARARDLPDGKSQIENLFRDLLQLRICLALLTALLIITTAWLTHRPLEMVIAVALGTLGLLMYGIQGTGEAVLSGYERVDIAASGRVIYQLTFVLVGSAVILAGLGYFGLIFANLLGILLMALICWQGVRVLGVHPAQANPAQWPTLLKKSIPFGIIGFALGLSFKFDTILLNIYFGDGPTGYYNAAYSLVFSSVMLSNTINVALYPSLARQATVDASALPSIYQQILRYLMAIALPIACGTCLLADQLVPLMFGSDYAPAIPILQAIIWVLPLMYASEFLGYIVVVAGEERRVARAVVVSTCINVLLNLLLIPRFGIPAATIMTLVTEVVLVLQYLWYLQTQLRISQWLSAVLRPLAATLAMGAVTVVLRDHLPLLLTIPLSASTYLIFLGIFGVIGRDEMQFLRHLQQPTAVEPSEV